METVIWFVAGVVGVLVSFYVAWRVCRASYLAVEKQFNVLFIVFCALSASLMALFLGADWLAESLGYAGWIGNDWRTALSWRWLLAVAAAGGLGYWYVRSVRYPAWKMLDMTSLAVMWGLATAGGLLLAARLVEEMLISDWSLASGLWMWLGLWGWLVAVLGLMQWWYGRSKGREGMVGGMWMMATSGVFLGRAVWASVAWQAMVPFVEWIVAGGGLLVGFLVVVLRWWQPNLKALALQDAPKRVSPGLQRSIGQGVAAKKSAATKPAKKKEDKPAAVAVASKSDGVAVVVSDTGETFAPPVAKPVKKLLKGRSRKKKA